MFVVSVSGSANTVIKDLKNTQMTAHNLAARNAKQMKNVRTARSHCTRCACTGEVHKSS